MKVTVLAVTQLNRAKRRRLLRPRIKIHALDMEKDHTETVIRIQVMKLLL